MAERIARRLILGAVLALVSSACSVSPTSAPPLAGPSGFALSFALTATPDAISQDGASQSAIVVTARDATGKAMSGVTFRLDMFVGGAAGAYGTLGATTVVTGSNGQTNPVSYTAPPPPAAGSTQAFCSPQATSLVLPGTCVTIAATPIGSGFASGAVSQSVVIHLVPIGYILPPAPTPTASFLITPTPVSATVAANFDASASCAGTATGTPPVCAATPNSIVSYQWSFGDGSSGMGKTIAHTFAAVGTYSVTLTVTNDGGKTASTTQSVSVTISTVTVPLPVPSFTFSPAQPAIGQAVFFNASTSTAAPGHTISSYSWTFGDGSGGAGATITHTYTTAGSYAVQLTVTDDLGQSVTSSAQTVTPGSPPSPTANFTFSPGVPGTNDQVVFDASSSSTGQGQTIVDVAWNYGDGTPVIHCPGDPSCVVGNNPPNRVSAHTFTIPQAFVVNLVVTDSAGRTGSHNATVQVVPALPVVVISTSPAAPNPGTTVFFNPNGTTTYPGSGIASFRWTFGDGGTSVLASPTHAYGAIGSYSVGLAVTDTKGRTGLGSATVTVAALTPPASPVAAFTVSPPSPSLATPPVFFDGSTSSMPSGAAIVTFRWNFGDGTVISGPPLNAAPGGGTFQAPHHTYAATGSYTVTLTVTDTNGLSGSTTNTVTVGP